MIAQSPKTIQSKSKKNLSGKIFQPNCSPKKFLEHCRKFFAPNPKRFLNKPRKTLQFRVLSSIRPFRNLLQDIKKVSLTTRREVSVKTLRSFCSNTRNARNFSKIKQKLMRTSRNQLENSAEIFFQNCIFSCAVQYCVNRFRSLKTELILDTSANSVSSKVEMLPESGECCLRSSMTFIS